MKIKTTLTCAALAAASITFAHASETWGDGSSSTLYLKESTTASDVVIDAKDVYFQNNATFELSNVSFANATDVYFQDGTSVSIANSKFNVPEYLHVSGNAVAEISNSELALAGRAIFFNGTGTLTLNDCATSITMSGLAKIDSASSMIVNGGTFTVTAASDVDYLQHFTVAQGSSLTFKNATVDLSGCRLATVTNSSYKNSSPVITIDGGTFVAKELDIYGYESAVALPELNIINGAKCQIDNFGYSYSTTTIGTDENGNWGFISVEGTYGVRSGTINVSGAGTEVVVAQNFIRQENLYDSWSQKTTVYPVTLNVTDGATMTVKGRVECVEEITIGKNAVLSAGTMIVGNETDEISNSLKVESTGTLILNGDSSIVQNSSVEIAGTLDNNGTLTIAEGSSLTLKDGAYLLTGTLTVSGKNDAAGTGTLSTNYNNGISGTITLAENAAISVGAHVQAETGTTQYLNAADLSAIANAVKTSLGFTNATVVNEIAESIALQVTTDNVKTSPIALAGGQIEVSAGTETSGTIGSYKADSTSETSASVRLAENNSNKVQWGGTELKTVLGETKKLAAGTQISFTGTSGDEKLIVVEGSALNNAGTIDGAVEIEGTLKGTGTITKLVTVKSGGHLVVGNSPGYTAQTDGLTVESDGKVTFSVAGLETAATAGTSGWTNAVYSQINLGNATLTIAENASIVIEFGGEFLFTEDLAGTEQEFSLDLVTNVGELAGVTDLTTLANMTTFKVTTEDGGIPNCANPGVSVTGATYTLNDGKLTLSGKLTTTIPEPSMFGLLAGTFALALAGTRRRRRER